METTAEDLHTMTTATTMPTMNDPPSSFSEDEGGFPPQMGSGRRDARVVCETFTGRDFSRGKASDFRRAYSTSTDMHKSSKHFKRRGFVYSHSRNPLLACFIGESVISSRAIRLHPNSDSASSQKVFFSLFPVDNSTANERNGEPTSPQLSCIGQVKTCRHAKAARASGAGTVVDELAHLDLASDRKEVSETAGQEVGKLGTRRTLGRARSFNLALEDIPPLDLNEGADCPRLMRSVKRPCSLGFSSSRKVGEEKQRAAAVGPMSPTVAKHSIQHFNHIVKQFLGASIVRSRFICGWNSRNSTQGDDELETDDDEKGGAVAEHYEIDLSRFASCDMQAKTPSFRESRYQVGKKLADIGVRAPQAPAPGEDDSSDMQVPKDDKSLGALSELSMSEHRTIVIKVERRKPSSEGTLWKRRSMDRPLTLEVRR